MEFNADDYVICNLFGGYIARIEVIREEMAVVELVADLKEPSSKSHQGGYVSVCLSRLENLTVSRLKEIRQIFVVEIDDAKSLIKFDKELDYKENTYQHALSYLQNYKGKIYAIVNNEEKKVEYCESESISLENYNYVVIPCNKIKLYNFKQYYFGIDIGQEKDYSENVRVYRITNGCVNPTASAQVVYKDINDVNKKEMSSLIEDINKILLEQEKEENKMNEPIKVFGRTNLSKLIIDENNRKVTALCNEGTCDKKATVAVQSKDDKFDKYVGAALAIAYQFFGSKGEFRKFVDEQAQDLKKIAKEKAAKKKQHLEEMEKAKAKKAEREAKKKELPEPTDEQIAAFLKKLFGKEYKKQIKKSK